MTKLRFWKSSKLKTPEQFPNMKDNKLPEKFAYTIEVNVMNEYRDHEPKSMDECRHRNDWTK